MKIFLLLLVAPAALFAQDTLGVKQADSLLEEVTVNAFQSHQHWKAVPAAVAVLNKKDFSRYGAVSMVPVLNMIPGVRMEERSPASYRLSLRGSLLRSPFGVRNLKVYWNDIPITDGGGNTYLNIVDMNQLTGAEIIKGPAASVYGAGTGGAVILRSDIPYANKPVNSASAELSGGSYGLFSQHLGFGHNGKDFAWSIQQDHQNADGYRDQSGMRKDIVKWQGQLRSGKQQFNFLLFYTSLYYQTPGGITLAQLQSDPKLSRQAAGGLPGAAEQKAAIYNNTGFIAVHHEFTVNEHFSLRSFAMINETNFKNPFITNYEKRMEDNLGAGTNLVYKTATSGTGFQWISGIEWLHNRSAITDYGNKAGVADTVQFSDRIYAQQVFGFSQAQLTVNNKWNFTAGLSLNGQTYRYKRFTDPAALDANKKIAAVVAPRIALLYRITGDVSLYAIAAKGFSAPAVAEIRPSDGNYYGNLHAESGWNYELGIKGAQFGNRLEFDLAAYYFALQNAIVRRNNSSGAEYFVNAGGTIQKGLEATLRYELCRSAKNLVSLLRLWSSYSFQPYRFDTYQQAGIDYSGNKLTGVPANVWVSGVDLVTKPGLYFQASVNSVSSIPLTDANDAIADAYQLVQLQWGYRGTKNTNGFDIFMGIDNLLNQRYSLGNDINAAGKRYYNPAAGINFFAGLRWKIDRIL